MQSLQTEKPRIENQFNQPLSMSVIFLPSLFHQLPPPLLARSWLSHRGGKKWRADSGWENREGCGQGLYGREELILSFPAWNSLQVHLLTSSNIMVMCCNFHRWHKVASKYRMSFRTLAFNASYIIINWKPLSSRLDPDWIFLYQGPKNVIRLLIANLWNGMD